jgi:hypothetical protein
VALCVVVEV